MGQYPETHDENGYTSLIKTASQGKLAIVEILIKYKPNISAKGITKVHTTLLKALCNDHFGVADVTLRLVHRPMLLAKVETRLSITLQRMEESKWLPGLSTQK